MSLIDLPCFADLGSVERAALAKRADHFSARLAAWDMLPAIMPSRRQRTGRVAGLSLHCALLAPLLGDAGAELAGQYMLWQCALDHQWDEEQVPLHEALRRIAGYAALLRGCDEVLEQTDPLGYALWEIQQALAEYPLFADLAVSWITMNVQLMISMFHGDTWRTAYRHRGHIPVSLTLEQYLEVAEASIGALPLLIAIQMISGDRSILAHQGWLYEAGRIMARATRLANDIRSYEREQREGTLNAVGIIKAGTPDATDVERLLWSEVTALRECCRALCTAPRTGTGKVEAAIMALTELTCDFYLARDFVA